MKLLTTIGVLLTLALTSGCSVDRVYDCEQDSECVRSQNFGTCLAPGHCAFSDSSCPSALRWDSTAAGNLSGQCVDESSTLNGCGGETPLAALPGTPCGVCDSGTYACEGLEALRCEDEAALEQNITANGSVSASTIYDSNFLPALSVDSDLSTSWFSSGPEGPGADQPSVFSWISDGDQCIHAVNFTGNEFHATTDFRTGFGFGELTVEVRDASDNVVFSKIHQLPDSPDPAVTTMTGGVVGRSVHLILGNHESSICGGFSELTVNALL